MRERGSEAIDLRVLSERALYEPMTVDDISSLSLSSRCALIRKILEERAKNPPILPYASDASLVSLSKTFNISTGFHDWQRRKRQILIHDFTLEENAHILTAYRNWEYIPIEEKQSALRESVRLHQKCYVEGLCEKLPYTHEFAEGALRASREGVVLIFGGFSGNLKTGHGRITQYSYYGELIRNPKEAFNTAHHEATHLVHHHFAVAFHRHQIPPSHPFYAEAEYFHEIDRHKAYVPSVYTIPYSAQPHEVFANWEGEKISAALEALAL